VDGCEAQAASLFGVHKGLPVYYALSQSAAASSLGGGTVGSSVFGALQHGSCDRGKSCSYELQTAEGVTAPKGLKRKEEKRTPPAKNPPVPTKERLE